MAQPEPWMPSAAAVNWARKLSKEPKYSSMAEASSPVGLSPPSGERFCQKIEWLVWPPRLKARSLVSWLIVEKSPASRAASSISSAVLAPLTRSEEHTSELQSRGQLV